MEKNQVIRWVLIASLLFSMFSPVLQAQDISIENKLLNAETTNLISNGSLEESVVNDGFHYRVFDANFEDDGLGPIVPDSNKYQYFNASVFSSNIITDEEGRRALRMEERQDAQNVIGSAYELVTNEFPEGSPEQVNQAKVEMDLKIEQNMDANFNVLTYTTNDFTHLIRITQSGKIQYIDYDEEERTYIDLMDYELGKWYSFVMFVDAETGTYTLYLNDTLIKENLKWAGKAKNGIRHIRLNIPESSEPTTGALYLDRLAFSIEGEQDEMPGVPNDDLYYKAFDANFENEKIGPIVPDSNKYQYNYNASVFSSNIITDEDNRRALRMEEREDAPNVIGSAYALVTNEFPTGTPEQANQAKVEIDLKIEENIDAILSLLTYSTNDFNQIISITKSGKLRYIDDDGGGLKYIDFMDYEPGQWYSFVLYVDAETGIYSLYCNDTLIGDNLKWAENEKNGIRHVRLTIPESSEATGALYLDRMALSVKGEDGRIPEEGYNYNVFGADFEDDELGPIAPDGGKYQYNYNAQVFSSNIIMEEDGRRALRMEEREDAPNVIGSAYTLVTNEFPEGPNQVNQAKIQMDLKIEENLNATLSLLTYTTNDFNLLISITKSGKLRYIDDDGGGLKYIDFMDYEPGQWYSFVLYVDAETGTYSLYCNDTLIGDNLKWAANAKNGIRHVRLTIPESSEATGALYLDRMALSAKGENPDNDVYRDKFIEQISDGLAMMNFNAAVFNNGEISDMQNASNEPLRVLTAGGIAYAPWQFFYEYFDAEVTVTEDSVVVQYEQTNGVFTIGESTFTVNGQTEEMPVPLFSNNGVIYLPVVMLVQALGKTAETFDQLTVIANRETLDAFETDDKLVKAGIQLLSFQPINREDITDQDFQELKQKLRHHLLGSEDNDLSNEWIAEHISLITSFGQGSWNQMNKDYQADILFGNSGFPTTSAEMTSQYNHLSRMAMAYGTPGSDLYQNEELEEDILYGLEWLYENLYGPNEIEGKGWRSIFEFNWWDWMVGVPTHLNNILLIMEPEMDQSDIEKYLAPYLHILTVMRTGQTPPEAASRVFYGTQAAILLHNEDMMIKVLNDYDLMLTSVEDGPGVQEDWLYITHRNKPYSGTYGVSSLLDRLAVGYSLLAGSKFEVRSAHKYNLAMWMYYMFEPIMYKGGNMIMFGGRSFSRGSSEQAMGSQVIAAMLDLIGSYGLDDDERLKKIIKRHVSEENLQDILTSLNISQLTKLKEVLEDSSITSEDYEIAYVYHTGDRVVQHRDNYAFGLSMSSSRVPTYESINQENQEGWYTGDGMTYLYLDNDLYQFGGDYRTNVNPYHLPGVTNDTQVREELSIREDYLPDQDFVGAAQLKDLYFTAALSYESYHNDVPPSGNYDDAGGMLPLHDSSLVAKKAWFAFDEEIVALGTGIHAEDGFEVGTTVDNRRLIKQITETENSSSDTGVVGHPYLIQNVTAVGNDGNLPINVLDGNYGSRWSYQGLENAWIQLELTESLPIGYLGISVYNGQNSAALFDIKVSNDGENWTTVYVGETSGTTPELEAFQLEEVVEAKYVRLYGYGRETGSAWNSYTEIQVYPPDDNMPLTLTNTNLFDAGAEEIVVDGQLLEFENDSPIALTDAEWVALENNAGYYFPNGGDLTVAKVGNATKFMELRLHHGVNPDGEEYAYVLLPHKNDHGTVAYAANPDTTILANTEQVQAIQDRSTGVTGIVFWEAGTLGAITVSEPMIVMVQEQDGEVELTVSDPTQKLNNASITIDRSLETVNSDRVLSIETGTQTIIDIDFADSKGKTYAASFYDPSFEITTEQIQDVIESYADTGAIANEQAERALSMHLTAVRVFEQQADAAKVVQHMEGFLVLLKHQQEQGLISKQAYDDFKRKTGALIRMWK